MSVSRREQGKDCFHKEITLQRWQCEYNESTDAVKGEPMCGGLPLALMMHDISNPIRDANMGRSEKAKRIKNNL